MDGKNEPNGSDSAEPQRKRPRMDLFGRSYHLPHSPVLRRSLGVSLVGLGFLGFLPVLGFWMIPLGLLVLSHDSPRIRRMRRQAAVKWARRGERKQPTSRR